MDKPKIEPFNESVPAFSKFIGESNYPPGTENDPNAPWNEQPQEEAQISGVSYDPETGEIIFDTTMGEVKIWSGSNTVIDIVDPDLKMEDDEFEASVEKLVAVMSASTESIPQAIIDKIEEELAEKKEHNTNDRQIIRDADDI